MTDDARRLPEFTRGKRPYFFADPAIDTLMSVVLEMAQEISVLRERQDAMERFMESRGGFDRSAFEAFEPGEEAAAAMAEWRAAYLQRLFRVVRREAGQFSTEEAEAALEQVETGLGGR